MPGADDAFESLAAAAVESILSRRPEFASSLGDHRFDDRLTDLRPEALDDDRRAWRHWLSRLEALDTGALAVGHAVDAAILRNRLALLLLELEDLRDYEWNPLVSNPGDSLYGLLARDYAPLEVRLKALCGRLAAIPEYLEVARRNLVGMPRIHVETALLQIRRDLVTRDGRGRPRPPAGTVGRGCGSKGQTCRGGRPGWSPALAGGSAAKLGQGRSHWCRGVRDQALPHP